MKKVLLQIFDENTNEVRFPELARLLGKDVVGSAILHYLRDKIPSLHEVLDSDDLVYILKDFEQAFELLESEGKNIEEYKCVELFFNRKSGEYQARVSKNTTSIHILYNYEVYFLNPKIKKLGDLKVRIENGN